MKITGDASRPAHVHDLALTEQFADISYLLDFHNQRWCLGPGRPVSLGQSCGHLSSWKREPGVIVFSAVLLVSSTVFDTPVSAHTNLLINEYFISQKLEL